jgi:hypothetical protein
VERTILDWRKRYYVRNVLFDPYQMAAVAQRLAKGHVPIEEYPQTIPNLTASTSGLFDLIQSRSLVLYPDAGMRLAVSRAVVTESSRGWKLDKLKQAHKIDVVVALSMACLAAVRGEGVPGYDLFGGAFDDWDDAAEEPAASPVPPGMTLEQYERITRPVRLGAQEDLPERMVEAFARARLDALRREGLP